MTAQSWTSRFKEPALKRITEYEAFLRDCGIIAVTGTELEFHFAAKPNAITYQDISTIPVFERSPLVEQFIRKVKTSTSPTRVGEIVLGSGPASHSGTYGRQRSPATIVRATQSARKILETPEKYPIDVEFGEKDGKRIRSLQCNISLWDSDKKTPLFLDNPLGLKESGFTTNPLTMECAQSLVETQRAMCAVVSADEASFDRYRAKECAFGISFNSKHPYQTLQLRRNKFNPFIDRYKDLQITDDSAKEPISADPDKRRKTIPCLIPSLYFEDRLASSQAEPALAMLISLGGIVKGVKNYMVKNGLVDNNNLPDPQRLKAHLHSATFSKEINVPAVKRRDYGHIDASWNYMHKVPVTQQEAFKQLEGNDLARKIMGEEFHKTFCKTYKEKMNTGQEISR